MRQVPRAVGLGGCWPPKLGTCRMFWPAGAGSASVDSSQRRREWDADTQSKYAVTRPVRSFGYHTLPPQGCKLQVQLRLHLHLQAGRHVALTGARCDRFARLAGLCPPARTGNGRERRGMLVRHQVTDSWADKSIFLPRTWKHLVYQCPTWLAWVVPKTAEA